MASSFYTPGYGYGPTLKMLEVLRILVKEKAALVEKKRIPRGFVLCSAGGVEVIAWYPTQVGRGLQRRGLVDSYGYITSAGLKALEFYGHAQTPPTTSQVTV